MANASADVPADRARLTRLWEAAWEDACAAVRACARMCPGYHKAHYRAAWVALKHPSISTRSAQNENEPIVLTEEEALPSKATESPETPALDVPDAARAAPPSPPPSSLSLERLAVREARAALQPLFKLPAAQSKASRLGKAADVANAAPPKFAPHMAEIDDGALTTRSGGGARGVGSFRLLAVGINESGRKFVAAARRATRLFLALCFAAGDLEGLRVLVASASAHFRDAARLRGAGEPADLAALGLAYATRATAAALTDPETDLETKEEALALAYWLWVEHGIGNGGPDGWGVALAEARGEARLESAFSEQFEEAFARADVSEEASAEAAALADAPPVLIGGPFAEALAASAAADVSAPAFAAHAAAHVEAAKARGDVQTLLALYQDAGRRAAETQRRLKRARHARTSAAGLEAAAASARAHGDALRGALLASLEAIVLASDATDVGDPVTESDVRARFGAVAAARALHRERAEAAAAASRGSEAAAKAAEYAVAAAANAEALLARVRSGDDPMDEDPDPTRAEGGMATPATNDAAPTLRAVLHGEDAEAEAAATRAQRDAEAEAAAARAHEAEAAAARAQRLQRLEIETQKNRERVGDAAVRSDQMRALVFEKKAQEAEAGQMLLRAVRAVKKMMGAATGDEDATSLPDEEDDFGEGARGRGGGSSRRRRARRARRGGPRGGRRGGGGHAAQSARGVAARDGGAGEEEDPEEGTGQESAGAVTRAAAPRR